MLQLSNRCAAPKINLSRSTHLARIDTASNFLNIYFKWSQLDSTFNYKKINLLWLYIIFSLVFIVVVVKVQSKTIIQMLFKARINTEATKLNQGDWNFENRDENVFSIVSANLLFLHSSASSRVWQWNDCTFKANWVTGRRTRKCLWASTNQYTWHPGCAERDERQLGWTESGGEVLTEREWRYVRNVNRDVRV